MPHARLKRRTKKKLTDKYEPHNCLTTWIENKKNEKHDAPTRYIKNWADSDKLQEFGSHQTFDFCGQLSAPKCPTFHIPGTLCAIPHRPQNSLVRELT